MSSKQYNPFRPGAGHRPPYLAGRSQEKAEFRKALSQDIILNNIIITGLRGVGKTVLLDEFKDIAKGRNWQWAGTDCSESSSITEETIALRILTDIALVTSNILIDEYTINDIGFNPPASKKQIYMDFPFLISMYQSIPGLPIDKLKHLLLSIWNSIKDIDNFEGIVFAYDEAQTLSDHSENNEYPLSVLLDLFQYLQRNGAKYLLVLTGLPTLLTKLIETRTYTERLFHVLTLDQLTPSEAKDAITKPVEHSSLASRFDDSVIKVVITQSGGYPYFIQFICREICDAYPGDSIPMDAIIQKLDNDFFAGRWARATDRERELMVILAKSNMTEFTIQDAVKLSEKSDYNPFSSSLANQFFNKLIDKGLIYKNRRGIYLFAVPLLPQFIMRSINHSNQI